METMVLRTPSVLGRTKSHAENRGASCSSWVVLGDLRLRVYVQVCEGSACNPDKDSRGLLRSREPWLGKYLPAYF